jgi:hypothetical protein
VRWVHDWSISERVGLRAATGGRIDGVR